MRVATICLVLAAITFAVFSQTLRHEFVNYDDDIYVYENPQVVHGLTFQGVLWAFTHSRADNWHPLTWISHMIDCQLYGLNPGRHHLTNVLLHMAAVIALFLVWRRMTGALWRSAFIAAIFAIHPLRVESVAWVAERKDVLSGLFFMLTIGAYAHFVRRPSSLGRLAWVVVLYLMGLMCKPMLVTLPIILLLLDYWPLQRMNSQKLSRLIMEKLPLLVISMAACAATLFVQHPNIQSYPLSLRLENAAMSCLIYLRQMFYPAGLALLYPFPRGSLPLWEPVSAGILLVWLTFIAVKLRRSQPWVFAGWLWYLVMLLPVIGIIQVGQQSHADRYTYLPQIGIYVALTWMAGEWAASIRVNRVISESAMAACVVALFICTWQQNTYWTNSEVLWTRTLACTQDNYTAHLNLGLALLRKNRLDEAIQQFEKALDSKPDYTEAHDDLGVALFNVGRPGEAMDHFQKALEIKPDSAETYFDQGLCYYNQGRLDEANTKFQTAVQLNPDYQDAQFSLGNSLCATGKVEEGITHFRKSLQLNPGDAKAHNSLGNALSQEGKVDEAITQYREALRLQPRHAGAHANLGIALLRIGKPNEALGQFRTALEIEPSNPQFQNSLAGLLATSSDASLRDGHSAVELAQKANAVTGGENPLVLQTLAAAYAEASQFPDAVAAAEHALNQATAHSDTNLAGQLEAQLKLYQANRPFHTP